MPELSFGEKIVRKSFNPSEQADVKEAKRLAAELIDFCYDMMPDGAGSELKDEELRLYGQAITSFEAGAMWLVKALTAKQQ
jgi:hypothetical protein